MSYNFPIPDSAHITIVHLLASDKKKVCDCRDEIRETENYFLFRQFFLSSLF
jgi:hypothetical protein